MLKIAISIIPNGVGKERQLAELHIANIGGGALADYKYSVSAEGTDEASGYITRYPRWSASVLDLVARAIAKALTGREALPRRPRPIKVPVRIDINAGTKYVRVREIPEPAKSAFVKQLGSRARPSISGEDDCVHAEDWLQFIELRRAR